MSGEQKKTEAVALVRRNIMISVDGSEHSKRAFDFYFNKIRRSGDHVTVFHAQELGPLPATYPYGMAYHDDWREYTEKSDDEAKKLLRHFGAFLKDKSDITFKLVKEGGNCNPGELICKNIKEEEGINLVILGSRGLGSVRRTVLGSVSDYIVHHCQAPVLVVPPTTKPANISL